MPTGRPAALTPAVQATMLAAVADGLSIHAACEVAGISPAAYYASQARARADPEAHPELAEFLEALGRARRSRLLRAQQIVTASLADDQPRDIQRATAFRVIQMEQQAEALELRRLQVEGGQRIVHSGSVQVGLTPERRAFLDQLRQDPECVRIATQMGSLLQPERLARMGGRIMPSAMDTPEYKELEHRIRQRLQEIGLSPGDNAQGAPTTDA